jgi:hypothetical protein
MHRPELPAAPEGHVARPQSEAFWETVEVGAGKRFEVDDALLWQVSSLKGADGRFRVGR